MSPPREIGAERFARELTAFIIPTELRQTRQVENEFANGRLYMVALGKTAYDETKEMKKKIGEGKRKETGKIRGLL